MKKRISLLFLQCLFLLLFSSAAGAQNYPPVTMQRVFAQQELDQMLAPIALYPDPLLSQILMASTYPSEVSQAAQWSRANPHLRGDAAVNAVSGFYWEPSVKSMVAFPEILSVMGARMDWTANLGDAFLGQQQQVMDTVQYLRRKALANGTLRSNEHMRVVSQGGIISIEPATQQVVYVPYYNPTVVYGSWWWPNYAPVYWDPWPGYYNPPGYRNGLVWGSGIVIGAGLFFGYIDWSHRHVYVKPHRRWDYWRNYDQRRRHEWQHNPDHRHGTPYRSEAVRRRFDNRNVKPGDRRGVGERRDLRGHVPPRGREGGASRAGLQVKTPARPAAASVVPQRATVGSAPATTPGRQPSAQQHGPRTPAGAVRTEKRPSAFEGIDKGKQDRSFAARGRASSHEASGGSRNGRQQSSPRSSAGPDRSSRSGSSGSHKKD